MKTENIIKTLPALLLGLFVSVPCSHAANDGERVWQALRPAKTHAVSHNKISKNRVKANDVALRTVTRMQAPVVAASEEKLVLGEDFSKFTAGSEEEPDMTNILTSEGIIMHDYINTYGWSGIKVFQAGGCCFMADEINSVLMTPVIDLSADNGNFNVTVSFRSQSGSTKFYVVGQSYGESQPFGGYVSCDESWKTVTIPFEGYGKSQTAIQFYADAPVFVDDIEITQVDGTEVEPQKPSAPIALPATDITETEFTANWQAVETATSYLLDVFYFVDNKPQYVKKDFETTATSETLSGLQSGCLYYYSVQANDGTLTSDESDIIPAKNTVDAIDAPVVAQATEISDEGFRANWSSVSDASYYEVVTLSDYKIPSSGTFVLDDETFDKVTEGTISSPVYNEMEGALNEYTKYPDWYGVTTLLANGMIGLKNYYAAMNYYSMLYSPIYQINTATPSNVKVKISAKMVNCTNGTQLGVALVDPIIGEVVGKWKYVNLSNEMTDYEFTLDASNCYYISIGFSDPNDKYGTTGMVFIDGVKITQDIEAGTTLTRIYSDDIAYNNSIYVATPEKREGEQFYYYVMAASNGTEGDVVSSESEIMYVGQDTGIDNAGTTATTTITAAAGQINVTTDKTCTLTVFDMSGRTVKQLNAVSGSASVSVEPGAYIVKCGNAVRKLIVK